MSYDVEGMKRRAAAARAGGRFWKPPVGDTKVRILPGTVGNCDPGTFYREVRLSRIQTKDGWKVLNVGPSDKWCPVMETVRLFKEHGMNDEAKNLSPRTTFGVNLVVQGTSDVLVWQMSSTQLEKLLSLLADDDWGDFTDPESGYCVKVTATGEGLSRRYDITPSKTSGDLPLNWEEQAHDLEEACAGETMDTKAMIALLDDKYQDVYEGLASELIRSRNEWIRARKKESTKSVAKTRTKTKVKSKKRRG